MNNNETRTTVSVSTATKSKMDKWRPSDQCYDEFLCQIMNLWERRYRYDSTGIKNICNK